MKSFKKGELAAYLNVCSYFFTMNAMNFQRTTSLLFLLTAFLLSWNGFAQQLFDRDQLNNPLKYGPAIAEKLETFECYEYKIPAGERVVLENGFRQSGFVNASEWIKIKDEVDVVGVDIVYSKYPIRNEVYNEIYPLLLNRIKATLAMDPALNTSTIRWRKVWQTHCENNAQVDELYHGVVIWYKRRKKPDTGVVIDKPDTIRPPKTPTVQVLSALTIGNEEPSSHNSAAVNFILDHPLTPDSLKAKALTLSSRDREQLIYSYFQEQRKIAPNVDSLENPFVRMKYIYAVEGFMQQFPTVKPVVSQVFDRHPEWKNKIVVNDWTGSMYGYGSQVLLWHLVHLDSSGIKTITLFNDGDNKTTERKVIGRTKGIYTEKANNAESLIELFTEVMRKGGGGDGPENDIEAILEAIEEDPEAEIILIADNGACVRDIELAHKIGRPVRIVLCGYNPEEGVNPDFVYLASITGGGIYTIEEDIENISANFDANGAIRSFDDDRLELSSPQCFDGVFGKAEGRRYSLKTARHHKKSVRILNASKQELTEIPPYVYKMKGIQSLNISNNALTALTDELLQLRKLSVLHAAGNQLTSITPELDQLGFLEYIFLNNNSLTALPQGIYELDFLKDLDGSHNQLTSIEKFDSRVLESLNVSHNRLTALPSLSRQQKLINLSASHNQLTAFPEEIPFKNLQTIDLSFNNITQLPADLSVFSELKSLNLKGNPISETERLRIREALFHVELTF